MKYENTYDMLVGINIRLLEEAGKMSAYVYMRVEQLQKEGIVDKDESCAILAALDENILIDTEQLGESIGTALTGNLTIDQIKAITSEMELIIRDLDKITVELDEHIYGKFEEAEILYKTYGIRISQKKPNIKLL